MCFPRNPRLGRYNADRAAWRVSYRKARLMKAAGKEPDPSSFGIDWKAQLIIAHDRERLDSLTISLAARYISHNLIAEILSDAAY